MEANTQEEIEQTSMGSVVLLGSAASIKDKNMDSVVFVQNILGSEYGEGDKNSANGEKASELGQLAQTVDANQRTLKDIIDKNNLLEA